MPRRLMLAAEIVRDVAHHVPEADRSMLESVASVLTVQAAGLAADLGIALELSPAMEAIEPSIRRLAAALDPELDRGDARLPN